MGRKWGVEGPPEEAYSRVTNPKRFRPLHGSAERLLGRIEATFDVEREEGYELDDELDRYAARPTVRLAPRSTEGGSLTIVFTSFPGLLVRLGHWSLSPFPSVGARRVTRRPSRNRLDSSRWSLISRRVGSPRPSGSGCGRMGGWSGERLTP
jgi:hypothetical protein